MSANTFTRLYRSSAHSAAPMTAYFAGHTRISRRLILLPGAASTQAASQCQLSSTAMLMAPPAAMPLAARAPHASQHTVVSATSAAPAAT